MQDYVGKLMSDLLKSWKDKKFPSQNRYVQRLQDPVFENEYQSSTYVSTIYTYKPFFINMQFSLAYSMLHTVCYILHHR